MSKKFLDVIFENYINMNKMMVSEMDMATTHGGTTGSHREDMWYEFFRRIIPKKFSMEKGVFIIDSNGKISNEVDIAVFDEQYTPYVFQYNNLKFIPIEAVAIVIECKSKSLDKKNLINWSESINKLKTNPTGIARMATGFMMSVTTQFQIKTRPIKILASLKKVNEKCNTKNGTIEELSDKFDFIIYKYKENSNGVFEVCCKNEDKKLSYWVNELLGVEFSEKFTLKNFNDKHKEKIKEFEYIKIKVDGKEYYLENTLEDLKIESNPIMTLNFQLNQLLMLINNPMLFSHFAYAKLFKDIEKER